MRPCVRDYIGESGVHRVARYRHPKKAKADALPVASTEIGIREVEENGYLGTSRWGRTWTEVRRTCKIEPLSDPPTVNG